MSCLEKVIVYPDEEEIEFIFKDDNIKLDRNELFWATRTHCTYDDFDFFVYGWNDQDDCGVLNSWIINIQFNDGTPNTLQYFLSSKFEIVECRRFGNSILCISESDNEKARHFLSLVEYVEHERCLSTLRCFV
jgi:hypothetical protein